MLDARTIFETILPILRDKRFLDLSLSGAEVPFYICPYDVAIQKDVDDLVKHLITNLLQEDIPVLEINLFNLLVRRLQENDDLDWEIEHEKDVTRYEMLSELQGVLDIETEIVPAIRELREKTRHKLIFLTGIGACYPVLRAHMLLNNLFSVVTNVPLVLFFPGQYCQIPGSGATLELFGRFHGDGYYRAFNLLETRI